MIKKNLIIASGFFNPPAQHHIYYLKASKNLFNTPSDNDLFVIVNNDIQVKLKNSIPFYSENTRLLLIFNFEDVDCALLSIDEDESISKTIESIYLKNKHIYNNFYFTNGGPKITSSKEVNLCKKLGIECLYGIGGEKKIESSSWIIELAAKAWINKNFNEDKT